MRIRAAKAARKTNGGRDYAWLVSTYISKTFYFTRQYVTHFQVGHSLDIRRVIRISCFWVTHCLVGLLKNILYFLIMIDQSPIKLVCFIINFLINGFFLRKVIGTILVGIIF